MIVVFSYGDEYIVTQLGMPEEAIRIGVGETIEAACANMCSSPIQSGRSIWDAVEWAIGASMLGEVGEGATWEEIEDEIEDATDAEHAEARAILLVTL